MPCYTAVDHTQSNQQAGICEELKSSSSCTAVYIAPVPQVCTDVISRPWPVLTDLDHAANEVNLIEVVKFVSVEYCI